MLLENMHQWLNNIFFEPIIINKPPKNLGISSLPLYKLELLNNEKDEISERLNIKDDTNNNDTEKLLREEVKSLKDIIEKNGLNSNITNSNNNSHNHNHTNSHNNTNSNNTNTIQIIINNYKYY